MDASAKVARGRSEANLEHLTISVPSTSPLYSNDFQSGSPSLLRRSPTSRDADRYKSSSMLRTPTSKEVVWIQQYDPRRRQYYYLNGSTGETTLAKPRFFSKELRERKSVAALTMQCALRSHLARTRAAALRVGAPATSHTGDAVLDEAYARKTKHIASLLTDIANLLVLRTPSFVNASSTDNDDDNKDTEGHLDRDELLALYAEFESTLRSLTSTFAAVEAVIRELQDQALLLTKHEDINETLIQVQKGAVRLHRTILEKDARFCEMDAARLNAAYATYTTMVAESKQRDTTSVLQKALRRCEAIFRRTLGPAAVQTGRGMDVTKVAGKVFADWHDAVTMAVESVRELEAAANVPITPAVVAVDVAPIVEAVPPPLVATVMPEVPETKSPRRSSYDVAYLQARWASGLKLRAKDADAQRQRASAAEQQRYHAFQDRVYAQAQYREERNRCKLTIWEAVVEGWSVEKMSHLVAQETKRTMQDGVSSFRLRDAQSENGRTLLQLACWWGHEHLVRYFVEKGSNLGQFDSVCNRFTLLHDAARAGHAPVVRALLEYGLSVSVVDASGDLPLHWASRRNHLDAAKALLECDGKPPSAHVARWKSLGTRNARGKLPIDVTNSFSLRKFLLDEQDKALRGLEAHAAEAKVPTGTTDPYIYALRRRDAVIGPHALAAAPLRRATLLLPAKPNHFGESGEYIDARRQKELRVKKATAKAVKQLTRDGAKRSLVRAAGQKLKAKLRPRKKSSYVGDPDAFPLDSWD
ncbi:hypothetical protein SDRG_02791 [Saprolegnia diclina VS20]|uniref:Uncharacterized protein n=1 Tax=Saprolegnia diclina (strain VS20) TaxID=1156394 RepID=T0QZJ9_SAPDV|nr:hypothetical protein SDRG_02791 [Saprolegnia diclina VS20]EQC40141.1 hypothetical protein SDRG_02791 [Saprolegnia diclina VS20]|eukprot:XP_008606615.1 hypothetical protein SDRG_02791 [Saprolegnia diclina VS20]